MSIFNKLFGSKNVEIINEPLLPRDWIMPIAGEVIPLSELPDQAFAEGMMGAGFAINASKNTVCSPVNGEIVSLFPGGHALAMITDNGCELLIHIGIDTVGLKGEGFKPLSEQGAQVKIGDPLVEVDFDLLAEKVPNSSVIIVFTEIKDGEIIADNQQLKRKA